MRGSGSVITPGVGIGLLALILGGCNGGLFEWGVSERAYAEAGNRAKYVKEPGPNRDRVARPLRVLVDFTVSQPARGVLLPDDEVTVVLSGGTPPYTESVTGTGLVVKRQAKENEYRVKADKEAKGRYEVDFEDGFGRVKRIEFVVTAPPVLVTAPLAPLTVTPATSKVVTPDGAKTVAFDVFGGTPPYTSIGPAGDSHDAIVVAPATGSQLSRPRIAITVRAEAAPGTYTAEIADARGERAAFSVTLAERPRLVTATGEGRITIKAGGRAAFGVVGGQAPYRPQPIAPTLVVKGPTEREPNNVVVASDPATVPGAYLATVLDSLGQAASIIIAVEKGPEPAKVPGKPKVQGKK